ncbi:MAG: carboxypeptidase-like regulatory domain-containing protein, partial [Acidobacteriaceae bacterium]
MMLLLIIVIGELLYARGCPGVNSIQAFRATYHPVLTMRMLIIAAEIVLCSVQIAAQLPTITGTVLDAQGRPVGQAAVFAAPDGAIGGILPTATTDAFGNFKMTSGLRRGAEPAWGMYYVSASKESAGYGGEPERFPAPPNARPIGVNLSEKHSLANVIVQLGMKSAVLVGSVTDDLTG